MNDTAEILGGAAIGAFVTLAGVAIWLGIRKTWMLGQSVGKSLSSVSKLIESQERFMESNQRVSERLELLVAILSGQSPLQTLESPPQGYQAEAQRPSRPTPPWAQAPDAEDSDTEVYDTSEADLVAYEQLEELKARGIEVEEDLDHNPPGVTAHV